MGMQPSSSGSQRHDSSDDHLWRNLYTSLTPHARNCIHSADVQSWRGQEHDLLQDIIQESVVRTFIHTQRGELGETSPIISLPRFSKRVVHNYCQDLRRKDARVMHLTCSDYTHEVDIVKDDWIDQTETVLNEMTMMSFFLIVARIIVSLPNKQRRALLIDLAMLSDFGTKPGPLEQALLQVDIHLKDYQGSFPSNQVERVRHSALLSIAYKRLRKEANVQLRKLDLVA